jgi:ribokinase
VDVTVVGYLSLDDITCPAGHFTSVPGGAAYYCAAAAAAAGARVALVASAGIDFPEDALEQLEALGVVLDTVRRDDGPSPRSRMVDPSGRERTAPHHRDPIWWAAQRRLAPPIAPDGASVFVFSSMSAEILAAQVATRRPTDRMVLDTSVAFASVQAEAILARVPHMHLFAPSREETRLLLPGPDDSVALRSLAAQVPIAVQKRGADGLALLRRGGTELLEPTRASLIVDTTGAGDSVVGALAAGLAQGLPDRQMLVLASRIAAMAITGVGIAGLVQR